MTFFSCFLLKTLIFLPKFWQNIDPCLEAKLEGDIEEGGLAGPVPRHRVSERVLGELEEV